MSADILLALVGFAIAASITPGPNNLLVLTSGLHYGVPRTFPLIGGIVAGFVIMLVVIGIGLGTAIQSNPVLHTAAKALGLAYMLWLAWKVARSPIGLAAADDRRGTRPLSAFTGATFQWVNPKAWAIALSAIAAFSIPNDAAATLGWIALVFAVISFLSLSVWAVFGTLMRSLVDTPSKMRAFNIAMALLLIASAAPVAYDLLAHSA
jgi:threonine/homoserine/homoserine lactone efflux protein